MVPLLKTRLVNYSTHGGDKTSEFHVPLFWYGLFEMEKEKEGGGTKLHVQTEEGGRERRQYCKEKKELRVCAAGSLHKVLLREKN